MNASFTVIFHFKRGGRVGSQFLSADCEAGAAQEGAVTPTSAAAPLDHTHWEAMFGFLF